MAAVRTAFCSYGPDFDREKLLIQIDILGGGGGGWDTGVYEDATKKILEDLLSEDDTDLDTDEDVDKSEA